MISAYGQLDKPIKSLLELGNAPAVASRPPVSAGGQSRALLPREASQLVSAVAPPLSEESMLALAFAWAARHEAQAGTSPHSATSACSGVREA